MNIHFEVKNIPIKYIVIDNESFRYNEFIDVLDHLTILDEYESVHIDDMKLAKLLERHKVIVETTRGSWGRGSGLHPFIDVIYNIKHIF